jgi:hypothetical protein
MIDILRSIPTALLLPLLVILGVLPFVAALVYVRRTHNRKALQTHHDVTSASFNVIGVLYTVILAFVMVTDWERYKQTEEYCEAEGNALANLYRDSNMLPPESRVQIREALIAYARTVVDQEWERMIHRKESPEAVKAMNRLWQAYYSVKPKLESEQVWYSESVDKLNNLADNRRMRIMACKARISWVMWFLLIVGGVLTLGYMNLFGIESFQAHLVMTISLAAMLILILFIIYSLDNPFWGDPCISPEAFQKFLDAHPAP